MRARPAQVPSLNLELSKVEPKFSFRRCQPAGSLKVMSGRSNTSLSEEEPGNAVQNEGALGAFIESALQERVRAPPLFRRADERIAEEIEGRGVFGRAPYVWANEGNGVLNALAA